jgi:biopolymer transport protein TolR
MTGKTEDRSIQSDEQKAAFVLTRRAQRKIPLFIHADELNLVPYMDVLVNLIIFLLVTISAFLPLGMLSIFPLSVATKEIDQPEDKPKLTLSIFITSEGFAVAGIGGVLPAIPKRPDGQYDFEALSKTVVQIKDTYPNENTVILSAEKDIKYDVVIKAMDTLRNFGDRQLFFKVQLSPGLLKNL